jgi:hypothetical protein
LELKDAKGFEEVNVELRMTGDGGENLEIPPEEGPRVTLG